VAAKRLERELGPCRSNSHGAGLLHRVLWLVVNLLHELVLFAATILDSLNGVSIVNNHNHPPKRAAWTYRAEDGPDDVAWHLRVVTRLHEVIEAALQLGDDSADVVVSKRRTSRHLRHLLRVPGGPRNCSLAKQSDVRGLAFGELVSELLHEGDVQRLGLR
jgi:hypothetical protein